MEVDVKIEAATEALRKGDGACLRVRDGCEALRGARDLFGEDAADGGQDIGLRRRRATELEGRQQDPLADGRVGQDATGDVRGLVVHPPASAARAEPAILAAAGLQLAAHATPDGGFSTDDAGARAFVAAQCPRLPAPITREDLQDERAVSLALGCALYRGVPKAELRAQLKRACAAADCFGWPEFIEKKPPFTLPPSR
jgi:hypothetical protein